MATLTKVSVNGQVYDLGGSGGGSSQIIEITYSELKALVDSSSLIPGTKYRITDYITGFKSWESANHQFDIVVTAFSENKLFERAYAMQHEGDDYFSNCKLQEWQIWYSINNDSNLFAEAKSDGKGVIFRMIDEFNNDVCYDFKNALFPFSQADYPFLPGTYKFYTFSSFPLISDSLLQSTIKDCSVEQCTNSKVNCLGNIIKRYPKKSKIPEVVLGIYNGYFLGSSISYNLIEFTTGASNAAIFANSSISLGIINNTIKGSQCEIRTPVSNFNGNTISDKLYVRNSTYQLSFIDNVIDALSCTPNGKTNFWTCTIKGSLDLTFHGDLDNTNVFSKTGTISLDESSYVNKIIVVNSSESNIIDLMTL